MITFLASPKAFRGTDAENQRRAITSWLLTQPRVEVILYGDAPGASRVCEELGCIHARSIDAAPSGVPYFNAIVKHAESRARHDTLVYLNCDILMSPDLPVAASALERTAWPHVLMTGQRVDLAEGEIFDPEASAEWPQRLTVLADVGRARLHRPSGMDYFMFRKGMWSELPRLIIGRAGYDNALLAYCLRRRIPTVDGTHDVLALHQFHGYEHVAGGQKAVFAGAEAQQNFSLNGIRHSPPDIRDTEWLLRNGNLELNDTRGDWLRNWEMRCRFQWQLARTGLGLRGLWRAARAVGISLERELLLRDLLASRETPPEANNPGDSLTG